VFKKVHNPFYLIFPFQLYIVNGSDTTTLAQQLTSLAEAVQHPALANRPVLLLVTQSQDENFMPSNLKHLPNLTTNYLPKVDDRERLLTILNDFATKYYPGRDKLMAESTKKK